jgi:hypothetical protein
VFECESLHPDSEKQPNKKMVNHRETKRKKRKKEKRKKKREPKYKTHTQYTKAAKIKQTASGAL